MHDTVPRVTDIPTIGSIAWGRLTVLPLESEHGHADASNGHAAGTI